MPPRYAYWTILIDQKASAFRAREREELLPTFHQLKRKNADVVMKWFARGRLWESPAEAQAAQRAPKPQLEKPDGGSPSRPWSAKPRSGASRSSRPAWNSTASKPSRPPTQRRDNGPRDRPSGKPKG